jgi:hypothetical protein
LLNTDVDVSVILAIRGAIKAIVGIGKTDHDSRTEHGHSKDNAFA